MQDLEGDRTVVPEIMGEIHGGHAATPELPLKPVAVSQATLKVLGKVGQRSGFMWALVGSCHLQGRPMLEQLAENHGTVRM